MSENPLLIHTEITIDAPVSTVWKILTAFSEYVEWNPTLEYLDGTAHVGSAVHVRAGKGTPQERDFHGTITEVRTDRLLASEPLPGSDRIEHAEHRARAIDIGERLQVLKDYPTPPNCTSPFAPIWITEMVRRQHDK